MTALSIRHEGIGRFLAPVPIRLGEAIPIAFVGLPVNIASAWILGGNHRGHGQTHHHDGDEAYDHPSEAVEHEQADQTRGVDPCGHNIRTI
jgi:Co/Zn/Cd efflux system component